MSCESVFSTVKKSSQNIALFTPVTEHAQSARGPLRMLVNPREHEWMMIFMSCKPEWTPAEMLGMNGLKALAQMGTVQVKESVCKVAQCLQDLIYVIYQHLHT